MKRIRSLAQEPDFVMIPDFKSGLMPDPISFVKQNRYRFGFFKGKSESAA